MRTSTKGIGYQLVDLTTDDEAMKQVVALGYRQAPVVSSIQFAVHHNR